MATVAYPAPSPFASHNIFGPPLGHSLSSPVSGEMLSRFGPRQVAQFVAASALFKEPVPLCGTSARATNVKPTARHAAANVPTHRRMPSERLIMSIHSMKCCYNSYHPGQIMLVPVMD